MRISKSMSTGVAVGVCASLLAIPVAQAGQDQKGKSTLSETIKRTDTNWIKLKKAAGEKYHVRTDMVKAKKNRAERRKSLTFFGQLTDPQIADEMSPARLELIDPIAGPTSAAWRPQEALGVRVFDSTIRNMNANSTSYVADGKGKRANLKFAILTGDIADSAQHNEVEMFRETLEGGVVDPFSGEKIDPNDPDQVKCRALGGALTDAEIADLNKKVENREYTGVQDFSDWPGQIPARYEGFWDPDLGATGDEYGYGAFPKYPNLMDAAQKKMNSKGLDFPWYITRGNHDTLVQGNVPASYQVAGLLSVKSISTGCSKPWPNTAIDIDSAKGLPGDQVFSWLAEPAQLGGVIDSLTKMPPVPPDSDRAYVSRLGFKEMLQGKDNGHGFDYVSKKQLAATNKNATYYAFNRGKFRIIMLDTNAEGGGSSGNLDDPQYQWLADQLDRYSTIEVKKNGKIKRDGGKNKMLIIASHHTLETFDNPTPDEAAGVCTDPMEAGCDSDPQNSEPLHFGMDGDENVLDLLLKYPNVVAYVNGHTHHNAVRAFKRSSKKAPGGFWQINTASHVDFPQQSRTVEFMDNRDGTLSIFGTILNTASSVKAPAPGSDAMKMSNSELASLSRVLAANDPQFCSTTDGKLRKNGTCDHGGPGVAKDRNVELINLDPRVLWNPGGKKPANG